MTRFIPLLLLTLSCTPTQDVHKGMQDGVELSYRWNHPVGKPSELLLKLVNTSADDKEVDLVIDLYYQGRTVEILSADTCIKAGRTLNGHLNGLYSIPSTLTGEQIRSGGTTAEMTRTTIAKSTCP